MNIKKILRESDFDWADISEARLVRGMFLCVKGGGRYWVESVDTLMNRSDKKRTPTVILQDIISRKTRIFKLDIIMNKLLDGSLTICQNIHESEFDWTEDITPFSLDGDWIITFHSDREYALVQEWLFSQGHYWDGHNDDGHRDNEQYTEVWKSEGDYGFFFNSEDYTEGGFDAFSYTTGDDNPNRNMEDQISNYRNHQKIKWSTLKNDNAGNKYTLGESEFDWAKEHEVTYDVSELKVGHNYQFIPDLTMLDNPDVDEAPGWVEDYGENTSFYILNQEPEKGNGYITFKSLGKLQRMVYNGKNYVRLPYYARIFMWGRFKEIEKPQMEKPITESSFINESEFEWMDDAPSYEIKVGDEYSIPSMGKKDVRVKVVEPNGVGKFRLRLHGGEYGNGTGETFMSKKDIIEKLKRGFWIKEVITESEFDWAEDIGVDPLHVGNYIYLDGTSDENDSHGDWDEGDYIILKITSVEIDPKFGDDIGEVGYITQKTNIAGEGDTETDYTSIRNARHLLDTRYWRPYNEKTGLFESEFDWAEKTPSAEKIPFWSGKHDGTEPGNGNKTFIYTDENGDEHSVKVGGTAYKHRTRRHSGGYFSNDGEVSFYDSSITQDDIDAINNDPEYPDPFEGKYELELSRFEYNRAVDTGRLKVQVWDDFHPVNESEFNWAEEWMGDTPTVGQEYYYDYDMGESVLIKVLDVRKFRDGTHVMWKVLDDDFLVDNKPMFYDEEDNIWDPTDSSTLEGFMENSKKTGLNESEFDWAIETPEGYDVHKKKRAIDFGPILEKVFKDTRFRVVKGETHIVIIDNTGIYLDWDVDEVLTMNDIINQFRQEVNMSYGEELREEYREVYMLLLNYFKNN